MLRDMKEHTYARQTLERYTDSSLDDLCEHIIVTNFSDYIKYVEDKTGARRHERVWEIVNVPKENYSIINFGIGAPSAAMVVHCLAFVDRVKSILLLGMCGGLRDSLNIGDYIVPAAAVRGEGTSRHYLPPEFPAIPNMTLAYVLHDLLSGESRHPPYSGVIYTTDRRMWEFDEEFVDYLRDQYIAGIDMEAATIFATAYRYHIPASALMLVSDLPLQMRGIKGKESARSVLSKHKAAHLETGIRATAKIRDDWQKISRAILTLW